MKQEENRQNSRRWWGAPTHIGNDGNSPLKTRSRLFAILLLGLIHLSLVPGVAAATAVSPPYKNPVANIEQRVADLLSRMSLEDKINQLHSNDGIGKYFDHGVAKPDGFKASAGSGLGEVTSLNLGVADEIAIRNALQHYLVEQTPLGIPVIFHGEACHGVVGTGQTSYPVPLGLASSWDEQLYHDVYTEVALEARTRGLQQVLAPVLDIDRDPRWGRTDETMGEDGYLNGRLGIATVEAFQGSADGTIDGQHVAVTLKHFVGHGEPQEGSNTAPANFPPRILLDEHALPFRMVIAAAKPAAVMISYNEVDSVPNHVNAWLIQNVLRKKLGFQGLVVSDYAGIIDAFKEQHVAQDPADAAAKAMNAGMEVEFPTEATFNALPGLVQKGLVKEETINAAVARILALKFRLGLFENHTLDLEKAKALPLLQSTRDLALRAARESIILLQNKNNILPLDKSRYRTIAVVGPNANACNLGGYSGQPLYTVKLIDGIKEKVGSDCQVLYAQGCAIDPKHPDDPKDQKRIADAVEVAKQADLIVLAIGDTASICQETWPGRNGDRTSLNLYGQQQQLADAMFALGKPVIVYLMNGRPISMPEVAGKADGILEGWSMGQETGHAAADILFGDVNPSGKLTITIPKSVGNLPCYYDSKPYDAGPEFINDDNKPLFPFGFGLSYTTFSYSPPKLAEDSITTTGRTSVSVNVTNTGKRAGDEIAEMYVHPRYSSVTRPVKSLRGFMRVHLKPGEARTVTFPITPDLLSYHDIDMNYGVEPTDLDVMVGPSSVDTQKVMLKIRPSIQETGRP
jgi:beta-glucosidase